MTLKPPLLRGSLPDGYHETLYWRLTDRPIKSILLQVISIPLFAFWLFVFFSVAALSGGLPSSFRIASPVPAIVAILGALLTLAIHELVHGLAMRLFGARPQYGVLWKQLVVYATSPGFAFTRLQYLITSLSPLIALSLLSVMFIWLLPGSPWVFLVVLLASVNAGGAIGDIWISIIVSRYPAHVYLVDERDGLRIFLPLEQEITSMPAPDNDES